MFALKAFKSNKTAGNRTISYLLCQFSTGSKPYRDWLDKHVTQSQIVQHQNKTSINIPLGNVLGLSHLIPTQHDQLNEPLFDAMGKEIDRPQQHEYSVDELIEREHTLQCMMSNINLELHCIDMCHAINNKINPVSDDINDILMRDICSRTKYLLYKGQTFDNELITEKIQCSYEIKCVGSNNLPYHIVDVSGQQVFSKVRIDVDWILQRTRMQHMGFDAYICGVHMTSNEENASRKDSEEREIVHTLVNLSESDKLVNAVKLIHLKQMIGANKLSDHDFAWLFSFLSSHPSDYLFDVMAQNIELTE